MSEDVRELILGRMAELIKVRGISTALRNVSQLSEGVALPAAVLFDGEEIASELPKVRPGYSVYPIRMEPLVHLVAQGDDAKIGTDMNTLRLRIISKVLSDDELTGYSCEGSGIKYLGTATKFEPARAVQGDMVIRFSILYYLRPSDF